MSKIIVNQIESSDGTTDVLNSLSAVNVAGAGLGQVLQVVSTTLSDNFTCTAHLSFTTITGLAVNITPSSSSNKILVLMNVATGGVGPCGCQLLRDSTNIGGGDSEGIRSQSIIGGGGSSTSVNSQFGMILDTPNTTSQITYQVQGKANSGSNPLYINQNATDSNGSTTHRTSSTITAIEIAG